MTHRSKLGLLGFICVMIQSDEVESRLNLVTATTEHVISAYALTAHLITPVGRQGVEKVRAEEKLNWNKLTGGVSETFYCHLHAAKFQMWRGVKIRSGADPDPLEIVSGPYYW